MRLFAALNFDGAFREAILEKQAELRRLTAVSGRTRTEGRRINWTREDNLHLTLAFIGERESDEDARRALAEVRVPPFTLALGKPFLLGSVCCLGLGGDGGLKTLAAAVRAAEKADDPHSRTVAVFPDML